MIERIKKFFKRKKKYAVEPRDRVGMAYWVFSLSLGSYFIIRAILNEKIALPFLIMLPALIGIFLILFVLPFRALIFLITEIILRIYLFHIPQNIPSNTVVVVGKSEYHKPSFWFAPNYGTELFLIVKYLQMMDKPFSIYYETSIETLDKIMTNKRIRSVFLLGHGRRHGFVIDGSTMVDYCRYDNTKYRKDFVYQIHCNQGKGKSLVEYVVPKENQQDCLPEHGYTSNLSISQMFIDKIITLKQLTGWRAHLTNLWYTTLTIIIPAILFFGWGYLFFKMVS